MHNPLNMFMLTQQNKIKKFMLTDTHSILSIRRRALDLLYGMCDVSNAKDIVEEILQVQHF